MTEDIFGFGKPLEKGADTAGRLLERLVGPYIDEVGQKWADRIRLKRLRNLAAIEAFAQAKLSDAPAIAVPGRFLFPWMDAALNEDEPTLQKRWAALLVHAVESPGPESTTSAFVRVLERLTPVEAEFLDFIFETHTDGDSPDRWVQAVDSSGYVRISISSGDITRSFLLPYFTVEAFIEHMVSLGVLQARYFVETRSGGSLTKPLYNQFELTVFGVEFIHACRYEPPPPKRS